MDNINLLNCKINHCYSIINKKILNGIQQCMDMDINKSGKLYHLCKKYLKYFKQNGITSDKIIQYEKDVIKTTNNIIEVS